MKNPRLTKKQKPVVENFCSQVNGKVIKIKACGSTYRDAFVEYEKPYFHTNGTATFVTIQTRLELTPVGKIRATDHKEISRRVREIDFYYLDEPMLNLGIQTDVIELPKNTRVDYLYKNKYDRIEEAKTRKPKQQKPEQLALPLDGAALTMQEVLTRKGDDKIHSAKKLLSGMVEVFCYELGETIKLPEAIIILMDEYGLTFHERDWIAMMSELISPEYLIQTIRDVEYLRDQPQCVHFNHPVKDIESQQVTETVKQSVSI